MEFEKEDNDLRIANPYSATHPISLFKYVDVPNGVSRYGCRDTMSRQPEMLNLKRVVRQDEQDEEGVDQSV